MGPRQREAWTWNRSSWAEAGRSEFKGCFAIRQVQGPLTHRVRHYLKIPEPREVAQENGSAWVKG